MKINAFKNTEFITYVGVTPVRVVTDSNGVPIVNPTREVLSKYLPNVALEGDKLEYIKMSKLKTSFDGLGGPQIMSLEEAKDSMDADEAVIEKEVNLITIRLLCETNIKKEGIEKGVKVSKSDKLYFVLDFKFYDHPRINKDNTTREVFNTQGQSAWLNVDNLTGKGEDPLDGNLTYFTIESENELTDMPRPVGNLGFGDFIDFLYSYAKASKKDAVFFGEDGVSLTEIVSGDFISVKKAIKFIHDNRTDKNNVIQYGANVLFVGEVEKSEARQGFYPVFTSSVAKDDGSLNKTFSYISNDILKNRKPVGGKTYSAESKGIILSNDFGALPTYGLKVLTPSAVATFISKTTGSSTLPSISAIHDSFGDLPEELSDDDF
jgi:hypothetical protein